MMSKRLHSHRPSALRVGAGRGRWWWRRLLAAAAVGAALLVTTIVTLRMHALAQQGVTNTKQRRNNNKLSDQEEEEEGKKRASRRRRSDVHNNQASDSESESSVADSAVAWSLPETYDDLFIRLFPLAGRRTTAHPNRSSRRSGGAEQSMTSGLVDFAASVPSSFCRPRARSYYPTYDDTIAGAFAATSSSLSTADTAAASFKTTNTGEGGEGGGGGGNQPAQTHPSKSRRLCDDDQDDVRQNINPCLRLTVPFSDTLHRRCSAWLYETYFSAYLVPWLVSSGATTKATATKENKHRPSSASSQPQPPQLLRLEEALRVIAPKYESRTLKFELDFPLPYHDGNNISATSAAIRGILKVPQKLFPSEPYSEWITTRLDSGDVWGIGRVPPTVLIPVPVRVLHYVTNMADEAEEREENGKKKRSSNKFREEMRDGYRRWLEREVFEAFGVQVPPLEKEDDLRQNPHRIRSHMDGNDDEEAGDDEFWVDPHDLELSSPLSFGKKKKKQKNKGGGDDGEEGGDNGDDDGVGWFPLIQKKKKKLNSRLLSLSRRRRSLPTAFAVEDEDEAVKKNKNEESTDDLKEEEELYIICSLQLVIPGVVALLDHKELKMPYSKAQPGWHRWFNPAWRREQKALYRQQQAQIEEEGEEEDGSAGNAEKEGTKKKNKKKKKQNDKKDHEKKKKSKAKGNIPKAVGLMDEGGGYGGISGSVSHTSSRTTTSDNKSSKSSSPSSYSHAGLLALSQLAMFDFITQNADRSPNKNNFVVEKNTLSTLLLSPSLPTYVHLDQGMSFLGFHQPHNPFNKAVNNTFCTFYRPFISALVCYASAYGYDAERIGEAVVSDVLRLHGESGGVDINIERDEDGGRTRGDAENSNKVRGENNNNNKKKKNISFSSHSDGSGRSAAVQAQDHHDFLPHSSIVNLARYNDVGFGLLAQRAIKAVGERTLKHTGKQIVVILDRLMACLRTKQTQQQQQQAPTTTSTHYSVQDVVLPWPDDGVEDGVGMCLG